MTVYARDPFYSTHATIISFIGSRSNCYRAYYIIYVFMYIYVYSEAGWIRRVSLPMNRLCLVWSHKELGLGYVGIFDM